MNNDEQYKWVANLYTHVGEQIFKYTPQLFIWSNEKPGTLEALGSSILFKTQGRHYLITAGHCLKQKDSYINVAIFNMAGHLCNLKGVMIVNQGFEDKIDIGIIKLSSQSVELLNERYDFLEEQQVMFNQNIPHESDYLVVGFPITKTKINNTAKRINQEPLVYITKSMSLNTYRRLQYNPASNIIVSYNRRRSQFLDKQEMNMSPQPQGVSGGGLWFIHSYDIKEVNHVKFSLCAIMIEYDKENNLMIATKTEEFISIMQELEKYDTETGLRIL